MKTYRRGPISIIRPISNVEDRVEDPNTRIAARARLRLAEDKNRQKAKIQRVLRSSVRENQTKGVLRSFGSEG